MTLISQLFDSFTFIDLLGVCLLVAGWFFCNRIIEHPPAGHPSVSVLMKEYRRAWMREFVARTRVFDSAIMASPRQGATFYASASMIAIGGGLALVGNSERLSALADQMAMGGNQPVFVWEIRILVALCFATDAFLRFVWSHRLFGYCAIIMGAVPNDASDPHAFIRADQAAEINISAAKSYNRALRSVYFALGTLPWLLGPVALICSALFTCFTLLRREFGSTSRQVLLGGIASGAIPPLSDPSASAPGAV